METSYFGAQTMQNKVRFSFDELSKESHEVSIIVIHITSSSATIYATQYLKESLIKHLEQLRDVATPITRQVIIIAVTIIIILVRTESGAMPEGNKLLVGILTFVYAA